MYRRHILHEEWSGKKCTQLFADVEDKYVAFSVVSWTACGVCTSHSHPLRRLLKRECRCCFVSECYVVRQASFDGTDPFHKPTHDFLCSLFSSVIPGVKFGTSEFLQFPSYMSKEKFLHLLAEASGKDEGASRSAMNSLFKLEVEEGFGSDSWWLSRLMPGYAEGLLRDEAHRRHSALEGVMLS